MDWLDEIDLEIPDHFFRDLSEQWYRIVYPEIAEKDVQDLINQMSLVSLEDAADLQKWYEL